jgi:ATPase family AAA domain-containing protein 3A/B
MVFVCILLLLIQPIHSGFDAKRGSFENVGSLNMHAINALLERRSDSDSFLRVYNSGMIVGPIAALTLKYIYRFLQKPKVFTRWVSAPSWYQSIKKRIFENSESSEKFLEIVFDDSVSQQLHDLIDITSAIYNGKFKSAYSNVLLYGAPGTGKTLFARYFAEQVKMEYAETTGGAFLQEGAGIEAVNSIFDYAKKTKGLILFIDEADSLFVDCNQLAVGKNAIKYEVLDHFLNLLGQPSNKLMLICATNHPVVFDEAMSRRFTQAIEMPLPDQKAREQLFLLYLSKLEGNFQKGSQEQEVVSKLSTDKPFIASCVQLTDRMSGSDIETIVRLFGNDLMLHTIQKSESQFDSYKTMQTRIAEYRKKMALFNKKTS